MTGRVTIVIISLAEPDPYVRGESLVTCPIHGVVPAPCTERHQSLNQTAASLRYHSHAPPQYRALLLNIARPLK